MRAARDDTTTSTTTNPTLASLEKKAGEVVGCEGMVDEGKTVLENQKFDGEKKV